MTGTRRLGLMAGLAGLAGGAITMLGLTAAAAGTTWLAMFSWRGFTTQAPLFLGPLFMLGLMVGGIGFALRLARLPVPAIVGVQAVTSFVAALAMITGSGLPTPAVLEELGFRLSAAMETSQAYAAPVPAEVAGVEPLLHRRCRLSSQALGPSPPGSHVVHQGATAG